MNFEEDVDLISESSIKFVICLLKNKVIMYFLYKNNYMR